MNEVVDQGYVLHSRRYRETSAIVDLFTKHNGRVSVVAKGVKSPKSKLKSVLQPFLKLQIHAKGKSQLKTLVAADAIDAPIVLTDTLLVSGLYLNELLVRLLHKDESDEVLYQCYEHTLTHLTNVSLEIELRQFEKQLIESLGYQLPFRFDADSHEKIKADQSRIDLLLSSYR